MPGLGLKAAAACSPASMSLGAIWAAIWERLAPAGPFDLGVLGPTGGDGGPFVGLHHVPRDAVAVGVLHAEVHGRGVVAELGGLLIVPDGLGLVGGAALAVVVQGRQFEGGQRLVLCGRLGELLARLAEVLRDALAGLVEGPERRLGLRVPLGGGEGVPAGRLGRIGARRPCPRSRGCRRRPRRADRPCSRATSTASGRPV